MYSNVVMGVESYHFEELIENYKLTKGVLLDTDLNEQDWDGYPGGDKEPDGYIDMLFLTILYGHKEVQGHDYPPYSDNQIQRPFQLCVFLALGIPQKQSHNGAQKGYLVHPEMDSRQGSGPYGSF